MSTVANLVLSKDREQLEQLLEANPGLNIDEPKNCFTPLWCAITGKFEKSEKRIGEGSRDILQILLEKGADPSKKCIMTPPVFTAVVEGNIHILSLLLLYGANPNDFALIRVETSPLTHMNQTRCMLPIVKAIDNCDDECLNALIHYGAFFSDETIEHAKKTKKKIKRLINDNDPRITENFDVRGYSKKLRGIKRIVEILEDKYDEEFEKKVDDFVKNNSKTGSYYNNFVYFRQI